MEEGLVRNIWDYALHSNLSYKTKTCEVLEDGFIHIKDK
jgi:hypothetical protein